MQTNLFQHQDEKEILMITWYECGRCGHIWNELESIALCKKCGQSQNYVDKLNGTYNVTSWLGAKDDKDLFNQKGADRVCMTPTAFEEKYKIPKF